MGLFLKMLWFSHVGTRLVASCWRKFLKWYILRLCIPFLSFLKIRFVCKSVCDIKNKVLCFTLGVVLLGTIEINRYPKSLICLIMVLYSPVCCICNLVVSRSIPYKHQKNGLEYSTTESLRSEFRSHIFHKKLIMS